MRAKTMRLTDEYALNSEVCVTSGLYGIPARTRRGGVIIDL